MKSVFVLVVLVATSLSTMAQDVAARMNRRERHQLMRIRQGLSQGDLTPREAHQLLANHRLIRRSECMARADGDLTRKEQLRIRRMQIRANRMIYWQRHDRQSRMN